MLVKLGGKFHEKPSKGEEGLWRVAEMATKNAMFIGQPHTQRHLWRKRNGQKLDREVDSSKSLANSNTYLAHNKVQIFFEGSFLFILKKQIQWTLVIVNSVLSPILFTIESCVYYSACSLCYKTIAQFHQKCLVMRDCLLFRRLLLPESTVHTYIHCGPSMRS